MAVRIFCVDARVLSQTLTLMPGSVRVVGSVTSRQAGVVALLVDGPWREATPMPQVEMVVNDEQAFQRRVTFREKSNVLRAEPAMVLDS